MKFFYRIAFNIIGVTPLSVIYFMAKIIGSLLFYLQSSSRRISALNISLSFPDLSKKDSHNLLKKSLIESSKGFLENILVWFSTNKANTYFKITVEGLDNINESLKLNKGVILFTPHQGNIEVLINFLSHNFVCSIPFTKIKNSNFNEMILEAREEMGVNMVETNFKGIRTLMKAIKKNEVVAIASDQVPNIGGGILSNFFGRKALSMTLVSTLAMKTNSPCHSMVCLREGNQGHFKIIFSSKLEHIGNNLEEGVNCMNQELEKCIMNYPEQYAWEYKKYKHSSNIDPYN
ncbi:MAG: lysophospholipid acyltransferase family protein [SAR86 cluster bacterium]|nr:lysophospholipid acyltransferase family protein [SAR86 cluster bacterium]